MQYHIFKVFPNKTVEYDTVFSDFKQANKYVKNARKQISTVDNYQLKMIFAATEQAATKLLTTKREHVPTGDD